jgi:alcohol dehydrogenase class IV
MKALYRIKQFINKYLLRMFTLPEPEVASGEGSLLRTPEFLKVHRIDSVLVVTDRVLMELGLPEALLESLVANNIAYAVFDDVQPNPTIQIIENGLKKYLANDCQGIIALGGGSPMDCAKVIGARVSNPKKSVLKMRGNFKVRKQPPLLIAIPTTAGTGSETTVAAVISDPATHEKFAVADMKLMPTYAILDPILMLGLPPHITSTTGMDALTHVVESYIGPYSTPYTEEQCEKAVKLIFDNLESVYRDGSDIEKRNAMAMASFQAGCAFTRAMVGYVHAIAHNLGGLYGVPHGLANAVILPHVLDFSRKDAEAKLAGLAVAAGIGKAGEPEEELSIRFIDRIKTMNRNMAIPETIKELKEADIPLIAKRALKEAHPDYPVPTIMHRTDCEALLRRLCP